MGQQNFPFALTFDDVLLEPRESAVLRSEVNLETKVTKKIKIQIPLLSAAMDMVTGAAMAIELGRLGGLGVLHRNCTVIEQVNMLRKVKLAGVLCAVAVGAVDPERAKILDKEGADIIVIDTAHAHVKAVMIAAKQIKKMIRAQLIVGNIATASAAAAFVNFADGLKVGVGPGSICTTRIVAGVGVPQLTAILNVVKIARPKGVPVIADGGIKFSGDAVKALAAGAGAVMMGSMFAGTDQAPGKIVNKNGKFFKEYRGMGSLGAMQKRHSSDRYFQKGNTKFVPEAIEGLTTYKGSLESVVFQLVGGIRSGMGYIGAATIADMPKQARFVQISSAGLKESHPHDVTITKKAPNY